MSKPVVVYGASGYTGRLICEYLREYGVPFLAAGRDGKRVKEAVDAVPGIDTVDHEVLEVEHTEAALTEAFTGAKVVLNTVGPFSRYGHEAVRASLNVGAHYTDTNGEQDWMIDADARYGAEFAKQNLLLSPGIAQMYTVGEIAAQICLEQPGLDTLDIGVFWKGYPTVASTNTILTNAAFAKAYYLEQNQYVEWPADAGLYELVVPGQHELGLALPRMVEIGGSHAQRDLFAQIHLDAMVRDGQLSGAQHLLQQQLSAQPESARLRRHARHLYAALRLDSLGSLF